MRDENLELKTKTGSTYSCDRCYEDNAKIVVELWKKADLKGNRITYEHAAYVSPNRFNDLSKEYQKLLKSGEIPKEKLIELIQKGRNEHYNVKGGVVIYLDTSKVDARILRSSVVETYIDHSNKKEYDKKPADKKISLKPAKNGEKKSIDKKTKPSDTEVLELLDK